MTDFTDLNFEAGEVILLDKEINKPSFSLIYKLRKVTGIKKIGHAVRESESA